jgi:hypothetical protein
VRWIVLLVSLASCRQIFGIRPLANDDGNAGDSDHRDAPGDGPADGSSILADAPTGCYGAGSFTVCLASDPTLSKPLSGTLSTDVGSSDCQAAPQSWLDHPQPDACFVIAATISVQVGGISVKGSRPLVLLAKNDITIDGAIDVSSCLAGNPNCPHTGPAADYASCGPSTQPPAGSRGGGAGASFMKVAGAGGTSTGAGGNPSPPDTAAPTLLRGGCHAQNGEGNTALGLGGHGGGALYIVSKAGTIHVNAPIDASGEPGLGGGNNGGQGFGAGGGGSGGMIVLIAPTIALASAGPIYADGGGGGGGGSASADGSPGSDPDGTTTGGLGGTFLAPGGAGFHDTTLAGNGQNAMFTQGGAGGGGGGGGYVLISGSTVGSTRVSPSP